MKKNEKGSFTMPGEAGYEALTLKMAEQWGADVIRDSDGTKLSDEIVATGYGIYSTICVIRADNEWAKANRDKLQQNFLMSEPVMAEGETLEIHPLKGYFTEQFVLNKMDDPKEFWQVFDRTSGEEIPADQWSFDAEREVVTVQGTAAWHLYTVNFLAVRIWEEISMYNHITNNWDKEHLMAVEPRYPETQEHMLAWMEEWCQKNPDTTVVRFTSMFYNFAWFWRADRENRDAFSDWGSYAMTANPLALRAFEAEKGYPMTSEDFVNGGEYTSTHNVPSKKYREWMDFINRFVVEFGKKLIDIVHRYGKKAYVFYDDSWIGVEPYGKRFKEFGFDGIIKCVFNGFEARLGGGVEGVETHELRFHPYLFPTGLTGEPTFAPGGNPKLDASKYWVNVRRALLRKPVDRIGLGGYLHLVEPFPDFCDYIAQVADEFRLLKSFNASCEPYTIPGKVAILHSWGSLRSWICSGHLHEHPEVDLTNILESLSGLPLDVCFLSFDDVVEHGIPEDVRVIINAGCANSAWSGGENWKNADLKATVTKFVAEGGGLIGVNEPSATVENGMFFQLAPLFGIDRDLGTKKCLGKYHYEVQDKSFVLADTKEIPQEMKTVDGIYCRTDSVSVLAEKDHTPVLTSNEFGKGRALYLASFRTSAEASRFLLRTILYAMKAEDCMNQYICDNLNTECAYYPAIKKLVTINNSGDVQTAVIPTESGTVTITLQPYETIISE